VGGIRMAKIGVECDRCKKLVTVDDVKASEFYAKFSEREEKRDAMFAAVFTTPDGETKELIFEFMCPKCCEAVSGYLFKSIQMKPATPEAKVRKPRKPKPVAVEPVVNAPEPITTPPVKVVTPEPAKAVAPSVDYSDEDLFRE